MTENYRDLLPALAGLQNILTKMNTVNQMRASARILKRMSDQLNFEKSVGWGRDTNYQNITDTSFFIHRHVSSLNHINLNE